MWVIVVLVLGAVLGGVVTFAAIDMSPHPIFILIATIGIGTVVSCIHFLMKIYQAEKEENVSDS